MATVLVNGGEGWVCGRLAGTLATDGHYIGWGTGAGTAAKADTTLFTEATEARAAGTVTVEGTGASAVYQVVGTLTADGTKTITNVGNFTASTVGTLIIHQDHTGVPLTIGEAITYTFTLNPA